MIERVMKEILPPEYIQSQGSWKPLKYWIEELPGGGKLAMVCDACGATYQGKWEKIDLKDGGSRVRPKLTGGIIWPEGMQEGLACHCRAGEKWVSTMPLAYGKQVEAEKERRVRLAKIAGEMKLAGVEVTLERMAKRVRDKWEKQQKEGVPQKTEQHEGPSEEGQLKLAKLMNELQGTDRWMECRQILMVLKPDTVVKVEETYAQVLQGQKSVEEFQAMMTDAESTAMAINKGRQV